MADSIFKTVGYKTDSGQVYPMKILTANADLVGTGGVVTDKSVRVKVSRKRREVGIKPRVHVYRKVDGTAPDILIRYKHVPIADPAIYATAPTEAKSIGGEDGWEFSHGNPEQAN